MSIRRQATDAAVDVVNGVARLISDKAESRRLEPEYWEAFHRDRFRSLHRLRWLARIHHERMANRYRSFMAAERHVDAYWGGR